MAAISLVVLWLAVGFAVAVAFGTAARKSQREHGDDAVPERRSASIEYLRPRAVRRTATTVARREPAKRHAVL